MPTPSLHRNLLRRLVDAIPYIVAAAFAGPLLALLGFVFLMMWRSTPVWTAICTVSSAVTVWLWIRNVNGTKRASPPQTNSTTEIAVVVVQALRAAVKAGVHTPSLTIHCTTPDMGACSIEAKCLHPTPVDPEIDPTKWPSGFTPILGSEWRHHGETTNYRLRDCTPSANEVVLVNANDPTAPTFTTTAYDLLVHYTCVRVPGGEDFRSEPPSP